MEPNALKRIPLFASLSDEQLTQLLAHSQRRFYPRASCLFQEGEQTDALYVILSGSVKVSKHDEEGKEVILAQIGAHGFFGEMGLFGKRARSASVETLEKCDILRVSHAAFMDCFKNNFDLASVLIGHLIDRLSQADRAIGNLAFLDVRGRVAQFFLDHAKEIHGAWVIEKVCSKQDVAKIAGASREMVSRTIKTLVERGYVRYEKRQVFLLNRAGLQQLRQTKTKFVAEDHKFLLRPHAAEA